MGTSLAITAPYSTQSTRKFIGGTKSYSADHCSQSLECFTTMRHNVYDRDLQGHLLLVCFEVFSRLLGEVANSGRSFRNSAVCLDPLIPNFAQYRTLHACGKVQIVAFSLSSISTQRTARPVTLRSFFRKRKPHYIWANQTVLNLCIKL